MDKESVVHIHSGTLVSHKKECIWVSSKDMDEPRAYYTEWSRSEREKQISYVSAYTWNQKDGTDEPIGRAATETQT